jgi:CPA2 family monovalent cation:H+ antiporter-2
MRRVRDQHYGMLRGLFHGAGDEPDVGEEAQPRLHAVTLGAGAHAVGRALDALDLADLGVQVKAVRRPGAARNLAPAQVGGLQAGDVVILLGVPESLALAETKLLQG